MSIILATVIELHSCYGTIFPLERHPGQERQGGCREAEGSSALAEECKRENKAEENKNNERSGKETEGQRKSIPCLEERPTPKVQLC